MERASKFGLCSEEFDSLHNLNLHTQHKHKRAPEIRQNIFKCNVCGNEYSTGHILINHMRTHTGERPFKCEAPGCGVTFAQESHLITHIKFKHSDERPFKCDFPGCPHTDKTLSNLRKHKKVHSDERPLACHFIACSFHAKSRNAITRHFKDVHSQDKQFACSQCDYKTARKDDLIRHMRRHSSEKDFKCSYPQCTASFKNLSNLKRHFSNKHGDENIQCDLHGCGQSVATKKASSNDHLKLANLSDWPFQCPLCFKYFKTLQHLQSHCFVHTNEKPFHCGHCKYEAAKRSHVKSHISFHAGMEFPFIVHLLDYRECLPCQMTFPSAEFVVHCKDQHHLEPILIE